MIKTTEKVGRSIIQTTNATTLLHSAVESTEVHVNQTVCVVIGLENSVRVSSETGILEGEGIIILPGIKHKIDFKNAPSIVLYLEDTKLAQRVWQHHQTGSSTACLDLGMADFLRLHGECWTNEAEQEFSGYIPHTTEVNEEKDHSIARVIRRIQCDPSVRLSQDDACLLAGLERTTMLRRFRQATGLTFRAFKNWEAIKLAIQVFASGASLENSAFDSGFYDSPHFSKSFKKLFGVAPSDAAIRKGE